MKFVSREYGIMKLGSGGGPARCDEGVTWCNVKSATFFSKADSIYWMSLSYLKLPSLLSCFRTLDAFPAGRVSSRMSRSFCTCWKQPATTGSRACAVPSGTSPLSICFYRRLRTLINNGRHVCRLRKLRDKSLRSVVNSFMRLTIFNPMSTISMMDATSPTTSAMRSDEAWQ